MAKKFNRIFTIVIDSLGIGEMPDSAQYGDIGVDTLGNIAKAVDTFTIPNLQKLGLANLKSLKQVPSVENPMGYFCSMKEMSTGKVTGGYLPLEKNAVEKTAEVCVDAAYNMEVSYKTQVWG